MADYNRIESTSFAPGRGAEVRGIRLADGRHDYPFAEIHRAFLNHQVLFFKEQLEIAPQLDIEIGKCFGPLHAEPTALTMASPPNKSNPRSVSAGRKRCDVPRQPLRHRSRNLGISGRRNEKADG